MSLDHADSASDSDTPFEAVRSLSRRIVLWAGGLAMVALGALLWTGNTITRREITQQNDDRLAAAADYASLVISRVLTERQRQVGLLAALPMVADAARIGADRARELELIGQSLGEAERRFARLRSLDVDPRLRRFLLDRGESLDLAEVVLTDRGGFTVVATTRPSDFVQSDEEWWRRAFRSGSAPATAAFDESVKRVTVSFAAAIRERDAAPPAGVIKAVFGLAPLQDAIARAASSGGVIVELIDEEGAVVVSSSDSAGLRILPGADALRHLRGDGAVIYDGGGGQQRAIVRPINDGNWRVVARMPEELVVAQLASARLRLIGIVGGLLLVLVGSLTVVWLFMSRRIERPAAALAAAAEAVAAGDFSVSLSTSSADDEIGRLSRATGTMIEELRRLARAIQSAAGETATMSTQITSGAEHMASAAQQMADTSGDLSHQSTEMAQTIQEMASDAAQLVALSTALTDGAHVGVERNERLRELTRANRERFDASARELDALVEEVQTSASAVEALAAASEQIRDFVTLVRKMARQSKLLALNAAMEAARAGDQGEGFAVVAGEVRRLAASSAEAAERTEKLVTDVLQRIERSRVSSGRSSAAVHNVRELTHQGLASLGQVEQAVAEADSWTGVIDRAAETMGVVVGETTRRLDALARGTESFAAAMQEVAASSEEQSASTQQIAASAAALAAAAERLSSLIATVKLDAVAAPEAGAATPPPAPSDAATPLETIAVSPLDGAGALAPA